MKIKEKVARALKIPLQNMGWGMEDARLTSEQIHKACEGVIVEIGSAKLYIKHITVPRNVIAARFFYRRSLAPDVRSLHCGMEAGLRRALKLLRKQQEGD